MLSPIFTLEAITTARRSRYFWLRCIYALLLLFVLVMTYNTQSVRQLGSMQGVANLARDFFWQFTWVQLTAILLLTPAMTAGTIAGELERKTLDYLLVSPLSSAAILWGKLGARLLLAGLLVSGGIPVLALAMLLGGIPPLQILATAVVSLATLLAVGALSLGVSVWAVRTRDAILSTYVLLLALLIVPPLGATLRWWNPPALLVVPWELCAGTLQALTKVNPYVAVYADDVATLLWASGAQLAFAAGVVSYAGWRLRRLAARRPGSEMRRWRWPVLRYRPRLKTDAMWWKEAFVEKTALRWGCLVRVALVALLACIMIPTLMQFIDALSSSYHPIEGFLLVYGLIGSLTLLMATARAATLVTNEHERDTWLTLLSTPLTAREIVRGKLGGNLYALRWPSALCLLELMMVCILRPEVVGGAIVSLLVLALLATFCSTWGLRCSLMMSNSTAAMWSAVGTVVVIGGGYWLCCGMGIAMLAVGGSNSESMVALAVIPCMPFLVIFPNLMRDGPIFPDDLGIALLVAWVLGVIGYSVAARLLYTTSIGDFNRYVGRTLAAPEARPSSSQPAATPSASDA